MDITSTFAQSLRHHNASSKLTTHSFDIAIINSFLQEAYRINKHISELTRYLRSIRAPYLAISAHRPATKYNTSRNARSQRANGSASVHSREGDDASDQPMNDADRKRIEAETKTLLTTLSGAIRDLSSATTADDEAKKLISQRARAKRGLGALGRWAAGVDAPASAQTVAEKQEEEQREGLRLHREGVLWYLQRRLEAASEVQRDMVAVRLQRAVERNKSVLHRAGADLSGRSPVLASAAFPRSSGSRPGTASLRPHELQQDSQTNSLDELLTPEQIQMFEQEQDSMVKFYNSELQKIKAVESSLYEISSLQTELSMNLELQSENVSQLVADSVFTTENVGQGNKQLKKASERPSTARMVFWATCCFCSTLVVWDLIF